MLSSDPKAETSAVTPQIGPKSRVTARTIRDGDHVLVDRPVQRIPPLYGGARSGNVPSSLGGLSVGNGTVEQDGRYWAFISYSHKDAVFGRRLHRRLEAYALPRRLVGRDTAAGFSVPRRLAPIFRDREEFPAAQDLSAEVRAALEVSRSLIVVCSPAAAVSPWVAREIELFRELHPGRPVLAAIREGEPHDSLPPALRLKGPSGDFIEPLAADFRRGHDGWELGLLKLVAGLLGVGLDELVQRDGQRRTQRVTAVTAAALALVLVMVVLTAFAINARTDAERQRAEAEGLVEFMLTDLRTTLKGVGRLDAMTAVNERALRYYSDEDLSRLPPDSLERRARVLHAMGEDDEERGDHDAALKKFQEASRTTAALLAADPNNTERIFDQSQSVFWFGYVDYRRGRYAAAKPAFDEYKRLTDRIVTLAPANPKYRKEAAYADGSLCVIALNEPGRQTAAIEYCRAALAQIEEVARQSGRSDDVTDDLVNRHAWLADAYHAAKDLKRARAERLFAEGMLNGRIASDPKNMNLRETWVTMQRALAVLDLETGNKDAARDRLKRDLTVIDDMVRQDPSNKRWLNDRERIARALSVTL
jgi:tetratricopeptide (TPR) repeat protein